MKETELLEALGWPADRAEDAGQASWSGSGAGGLSTIKATISRTPAQISASVDRIGIEGSENLMSLTAEISSGSARATKTHAGEPPEAIPAEDAISLFAFMREGLARFKFASTGPIELPARKPAS